jgi:hypothetical protein
VARNDEVVAPARKAEPPFRASAEAMSELSLRLLAPK